MCYPAIKIGNRVATGGGEGGAESGSVYMYKYATITPTVNGMESTDGLIRPTLPVLRHPGRSSGVQRRHRRPWSPPAAAADDEALGEHTRRLNGVMVSTSDSEHAALDSGNGGSIPPSTLIFLLFLLFWGAAPGFLPSPGNEVARCSWGHSWPAGRGGPCASPLLQFLLQTHTRMLL